MEENSIIFSNEKNDIVRINELLLIILEIIDI